MHLSPHILYTHKLKSWKYYFHAEIMQQAVKYLKPFSVFKWNEGLSVVSHLPSVQITLHLDKVLLVNAPRILINVTHYILHESVL